MTKNCIKRIISTFSLTLLIFHFAVAGSYTLKASSIKSLKENVVKKVGIFNVSVGRVYSSATEPSTKVATYVQLNPGDYLLISSGQRIKSVTFQYKDGYHTELYVNDEKPQLDSIKSKIRRWNCSDSCGVSDVKFTYCCKSTDKKAEKTSKGIQIESFVIEYFDNATLGESLGNATCGLCVLSGDNLLGVARFVDNVTGTAYSLVKHDDGCSVAKCTPDGEPYMIDIEGGHLQEKYDQSNWLLVETNADLTRCPIKSLTGRFNASESNLFRAFSVETENGEESFVPNVYCPVNFMGSTLQTGADGKSYFFMMPKPCEYAKIVYAVYGGGNKFYTPKQVGNVVNKLGFVGGFEVSYRFNEEAAPELQVGCAYEFDAVLLPLTGAEGAARVATFEPNSDSGISDTFIVCPLNLTSNTLPTIIETTCGDKRVERVDYFNLAGMVSTSPFGGMNIVQTTYSDGSKKVTKLHF